MRKKREFWLFRQRFKAVRNIGQFFLAPKVPLEDLWSMILIHRSIPSHPIHTISTYSHVMTWDDLTTFWLHSGGGLVIMNFWSIVLDDHRSKKTYRPQMIVDVDMSGAIFISDDLVFTEKLQTLERFTSTTRNVHNFECSQLSINYWGLFKDPLSSESVLLLSFVKRWNSIICCSYIKDSI